MPTLQEYYCYRVAAVRTYGIPRIHPHFVPPHWACAARSTLDSHIAKTNAHLPENAQLSIGLYNGTKNAVVVRPVRPLYDLVAALRKIHAPAGADQSKIPYSQRRIVFSVVNVPYHSGYR